MFENNNYKIICDDCTEVVDNLDTNVDLTFLDPPFNQDKEYENHHDSMHDEDYWQWMTNICEKIYNKSSNGGSIFFMQREKNTWKVQKALEDSGWTYQNLIIWKKKSSIITL